MGIPGKFKPLSRFAQFNENKIIKENSFKSVLTKPLTQRSEVFFLKSNFLFTKSQFKSNKTLNPFPKHFSDKSRNKFEEAKVVNFELDEIKERKKIINTPIHSMGNEPSFTKYKKNLITREDYVRLLEPLKEKMLNRIGILIVFSSLIKNYK